MQGGLGQLLDDVGRMAGQSGQPQAAGEAGDVGRGGIGPLLGSLTGGDQHGLDTGTLAAVAGPVLGMLKGGGLQQVVGSMQSHGMGDVAQSWIGTGANQQADPDRLAQALGEDRVEQVAAQAKVGEGSARQGIAALLPGLVDRMTSGGSLPAAGEHDGVLDQLAGIVGR